MKFHNQKSFMGHEISNVTNKPLLHKKGKQWIVVAVSALILAGFGGVVSTTTHADTTATQPVAAKVAPKPANNPAKTTTSTSSVTGNTKSSVASSASSSTKTSAPKAGQPNAKNIGQQAANLHVKLLSQAPVTNPDQNVVAHGYWNYNNLSTNNTPVWNLYSNGTLKVSKNPNNHSNSDTTLATKSSFRSGAWAPENNLQDALSISTADAKKVNTLSFSDVQAPSDSIRLCDDETWHYFPSLQTLDLQGLSLNHVTNGTAMFGGLNGLTNVIGLKTPNNFNASLLFVSDPNLQSIDLRGMSPISSSTQGMFAYDNDLQTITLGSQNSLGIYPMFQGDNQNPTSEQNHWVSVGEPDVYITGKDSNNNSTNNTKLIANRTWHRAGTTQTKTNHIQYVDINNNNVIKSIGYSGNYGDFQTPSIIVPYGWTLSSDNSDTVKINHNITFMINGSNSNINIVPDKALDTINYVIKNTNTTKRSTTVKGNSSSAQGASDTEFTVGGNPQGLPNGYAVIPSERTNQIQYDGHSHTIHIEPINDVLDYDDETQGDKQIGHSSDITDTTGIVNNSNSDFDVLTNPSYATNMPKGYHIDKGDGVSTNDLTFTHQDGTHQVYVTPNQSTVQIHYQYKGQTVGTTSYTGNSIVQPYSFTFNNNPKDMPTGYKLAMSTDANGKTMNYNYQPGYNIAVTPAVTTTADYKYKGKIVGSHQFLGNNYQAKYMNGQPVSDTSIDITPSNANNLGVPSNYQLVNADNHINYDGTNNHDVAVTPRQKDTVNYVNSGKTISSQSSQSNTGNTSFTTNVPNGYHTSSDKTTDTFNYDNQTHSVTVYPDSIVLAFNNDKSLGTKRIDSLRGATYTINTSNDGDLPHYYHLANSKNNTIDLSKVSENGIYNILVTPDQVSDTINYNYNSKNKGSQKLSGAYNTSFNINEGSKPSIIPSYYHVDSDNDIKYDGFTHTVNIAPDQVSDTINYQYDGNKPLASRTFKGNDVRADDASDTSFTISNIPNDLAKNYHLANKSQAFNYDGGIYNVAIEPNTATDHITFNGDSAANTSMTGSYGTNGSVSAPSSYHFTDSKSTETFTYKNSTASFSVAPNTEYEQINYVYHKGNGTFSEGSTTMSGSYSTEGSVTSDNASGLDSNYHLSNNNDNSFTYINSSASKDVDVVPNTVIVNYKNGNNTISDGTIKVTYDPNSQVMDDFDTPAGYALAQPNSSIPFNKQSSNINIAVKPVSATDTINYMYNDTKVGSKQFTGEDMYANNSTFDVKSAPTGYHTVDANNNFYYDGQSHDVSVAPDKVTNNISYKGNNYNSSSNVSGLYNVSSNVSAPSGYHYINSNNGNFTYGLNNASHTFAVAPNSATENINYIYNNSSEGSTTMHGYYNESGNANNAAGLDFGYHLANQSNPFTYANGSASLNVAVEPNTVTINYMNGKTNISHATSTFDGKDNTISDNFGIPVGYQLVNNQTSLSYDNQTTNVSVEPIPQTNTINYMNGSSKVSSTKSTGNDYQAQSTGNTTFTISNAPTNYHLANGNQTFNYDGSTDNVSVAPNTITVTYKSGSSAVGSDTVAYQSGSKVNDDYDMPAGYQLAQSNNQLNFSKASNAVDVLVKPVNKTDIINYMYNDTKVGSTQANGVDVYANSSAFNANTKVPAGYHAVDANNGFCYDGQQHDVSVAPNVDTDTVDYQANGQTLASQQFQGNDENATQAGDNSFDVTAKNATKMPNGYELVNKDNEFGFDNGSHNVAVQAVPQPQPSVPFMPSMPASSASSASSSASAPASMAMPNSSATTKSQSASHYRYAKVVTPLQLHTSKHFTKKNGVLTVEHPTEFKIMKIVRDHKYTRYEVKYQGRNYFITANDHFTINDYVQKHDFKSHKHMMVRVIKPMIEYKHSRFNRKYAIKVFKKGAILPVKRVFNFGKGEKTRFELTNGRFVTSNKLFVKVIK